VSRTDRALEDVTGCEMQLLDARPSASIRVR
jgi:hypothetical protein